MRKLNYRITTLEPLIITSHSDDPNMYETLQYIRGTVIQGLAAQQYLRNHGADDTFTRLIIKGDCIFTNAFPAQGDSTFQPAPFSLVREKYNEDKVHNLLLKETDLQTKGISNLVAIQGKEIKLLSLRKELRLHNEIDDNKRITSTGILFNYQSVPAGIIFKGQIAIKGSDEDFILIQKLFSESEYRIGRSSTAEYGLVRFEWVEDMAVENNSKTTKDDSEGVDFGSQAILTLVSDTIIFNENGFSSLSVNDLSNYLTGAGIIKAISRRARIEGFLNIWKLRKPSENVFAAGSSFLLDKMPANAKELQNSGLGERTQEGYGQAFFTNAKDLKPELMAKKFELNDINQNPNDIPSLTREILKFSRLNRKKSGLIGQALKDANSTFKAPKNHLVSKLKILSQDPESFIGNLKLLRDTAQGQLKSSYIGNQTLLQFLNHRIEEFDEICPLQERIQEILVDFSDNINELRQVYFENYFNQLRRNNNKK